MKNKGAPIHHFIIRFESEVLTKFPRIIDSFDGTKDDLLEMCKKKYGFQYYKIVHRTIRLMDKYGNCFMSVIADDKEKNHGVS